MAIVKYTHDTKNLISGFKIRGTAKERWKHIDPNDDF